jgi:hypothetical protein
MRRQAGRDSKGARRMRLPRLPRKRLLVPLAGLLALVASFVLCPIPPSRVTRENYDRIREGMTRAEVEAILGPPGDYRTGRTREASDPLDPPCFDIDETAFNADAYYGLSPGGLWEQAWWFGNEAYIIVVFKSGVVSDPRDIPEVGIKGCKSFVRTVKLEHGPLDNLRWRTESQWRKWFP